METEHGETIVIRSGRWHRVASRSDLAILGRSRGPVLDVGCGPGRHVAALASWGRDVLGIDTSRSAVDATRSRGGSAVQVSVFGQVPRAGTWGSALLLDGNIGIGGDVANLLVRMGQLLRPGGLLLVETASPFGRSGRSLVRIRQGGTVGDWFPWAWVTPSELEALARPVDLVTDEAWHVAGRWFVQLRHVAGGTHSAGGTP
jgi:SAM-dependent methyltransferase